MASDRGPPSATSDGLGFQSMGLFADLLDDQEPSDVDLFGMLLPMDVDPSFGVSEGDGQYRTAESATVLGQRLEDDVQFESYAAQLDGISHGLWSPDNFDLADGAMDLSAGGSLAFLGGPHPADSTGAGTARRFAAGVALPSRGATIATAAGAEERAPGQIPRENHVAELAASGLAESKLLPDPFLLGILKAGGAAAAPVSQAQAVLARLQGIDLCLQPAAMPHAAEAVPQPVEGWSQRMKAETAGQQPVSSQHGQQQGEPRPQHVQHSSNLHASSSGSGEAEHGGGGKGVKRHEQALQQLAELKDRSRESQRRYRARRKDKLALSEERVAQLEAQVAALSIAKEELASQNEILRDFVRTQQHSKEQQQQQQQEKPTKPAAAAGFALCDGSNWLDEHTKLLIQRVAGLDGGEVVLTVRDPAAPIRIPQAQLAQLTREEMHVLGREYVHAIGDSLVRARNDPDSPAGQRLATLIREVSAIKGSLVIAQPGRMTKMSILSTKEPIGAARAPIATPEIVQEVIRDVALSERQLRALLRMRRLYLKNLGAMLCRRQELSAKLQAAVHTGSEQGALGEAQLYATALMERIRDTLRAERTFDFQFVMTMWFRVFTPIQAARAIIHSNTSARLDGLLIVNQLAEDQGDPPAKDLLLEGATRTDRVLLPVDAVATLA